MSLTRLEIATQILAGFGVGGPQDPNVRREMADEAIARAEALLMAERRANAGPEGRDR